MAASSSLINPVLVIDSGSGIVKAGLAGNDEPRSFTPTLVGRPKHTRAMARAVEGDYFIGNRAQEIRGILNLNHPMDHGIVRSWEDMQRIWQYIYNEDLKIPSEEHPVLLTETPLNPYSNRDETAQIFFENFNVPALYSSIQAVLALYASGRTTGIVLDVGEGVSHAVPVFEGFAIQSAIKRSDLAGRDITQNLQLLLKREGVKLGETSAEFEILRILKEKMCYLSPNPAREEREDLGKFEPYTLPDGNIIKLGSERFRAPEILFSPYLIGHESQGVHQLLLDSINRADVDIRQGLYSNIVLAGGVTTTKGFCERLLQEVKKGAYKDVKIKIYAPPERKYSAWIGGSLLASLSTFKKMWVTAEEYKEFGSSILYRKFST